MAPKYSLTYFNARGLAETTRLLFAYKKVKYTDNRIEREQWPDLKSKQPLGRLPVLEVDGTLIAESSAIARFVARELGLTGKNNVEAARCDMIMSALRDLFVGLASFRMEQDEAKKEAMKLKFFTETLPPFLANLEKALKQNGSGKYFVGDGVTWADIGVAHALGELRKYEGKVLDKHSALEELVNRVLNLPTIKEWIDNRPDTQF